MNKTVYIPVEIYKTHLTIFVGGFEYLIKKVADKYSKADADGVKKQLKDKRYEGATLQMSDDSIIIYLPELKGTPTSLATLVHELIHASTFLLESKGIKHTTDTEEVYAYLLEYLTRYALTGVKS